MMSEIKKSMICEYNESKPEIQNYRDIKPNRDIGLQECRAFWDRLFGSEILDVNDKRILIKKLDGGKSENKELNRSGGSYGDVFQAGEGYESEVHHMPADSISYLERNDGPAIKMEKEDHRQTASYGSSREAREYRAVQKELIEQGKFREAVEMDISDIREKFGNKYDTAIAEMLDYVKKLEMEGKLDG